MANSAPSGPAQVSIVVLNYNGLDDTVKCLQSLRPIQGVHVILVDNASDVDPTEAALAVYPGLEVVRTSQNLGYAGGNNRGIDRAVEHGSDYVLILNNDTVVDPSIVDALLAAFDADPHLGIAGPVINYLDEPTAVMTDGVAFNPGPGTEFFPRIVVPVSPGAASHPVPVDIVNGCCMMVRASVFAAIGRFDETFFIVHEESDFCLRAGLAGFRCAILGQSLVWHKGSSAFVRSGRQLQRYFDARNLYFLLARHSGRFPRSRRWLPSLMHYLLYAFYRYDVEMDAGKPIAGRSVVMGVYDGLRRWTGPLPVKRRIGFTLALWCFAIARQTARAKRLIPRP